jgi:hypothetical protein
MKKIKENSKKIFIEKQFAKLLTPNNSQLARKNGGG